MCSYCMCICVCALQHIKWVISSQQKLDTKTLILGVESKLPSNKQLSAVLWPEYHWAAGSIWSFINSSWIHSAVPFEHIAFCSCWLGCDWCAAAFWLLYSPLPRNHQNSPRELSSTHSKPSGGRTPTNQTQTPSLHQFLLHSRVSKGPCVLH